MKSYVINLDRAPERLAAITAQFQAQALEFTRQTAVDSTTISDKACLPFELLSSKDEIACFLSHRLLWQKIAENSAPYAAVFEDDALLSPHACRFLEHWGWIPPDADIVKIETQRKKVWLGAPQKLDSTFSVARLKSTHILSAGYIISRRAAARLFQTSSRISLPLDHFLFNFNYEPAQSLVLYQLDRAIVRQAGATGSLRGKPKSVMSMRQKLPRELRRLGTNGTRGLWGLRINLTTDECWKRIPFDGKK